MSARLPHARPRGPALLALLPLLLLLAACGAPQGNRPPPVEASVQEQARVFARVTPQWLFDQGVALADAGDPIRAEQYLAAALRRGAPSEPVLRRLIRVCIGAQRYRAAIEYAQPYLATHEDAWRLRFLVATIYTGLGDHGAARRQFELVLRHNEAHADAHFVLGALLRDELGDPQAADAHFRRYLELEPDGEHAAEARSGLLTPVNP